MKIFPVPQTITELTDNIREIVEKHSILSSKPNYRYLDRQCAVLDIKEEALLEAEEIETAVLEAFDRISKRFKLKPNELYSFKGVLTVYDYQLQFENLHPSEVGKTSFLPHIMKRIDAVYRSISKKEILPNFSKFEEELRTKNRSAKDNLQIHGKAQYYLSYALLQKSFVPHMQGYNLANILSSFSERQIDLKPIDLTQETASVARLIGPNSSFLSESTISFLDIATISAVNFPLGMLLSNAFQYYPEHKFFVFNVGKVTTEIAKSILSEIHETLKISTLSPNLRKHLEYTRDTLRRQYIVKSFNLIRENYSQGTITAIQNFEKVSEAEEPLDMNTRVELIANRLVATLLGYNRYLASNPGVYENFEYHMDIQILIAEFSLKAPIFDEIFRSAHARVLSKIEGIKIDQYPRYRQFQKTVHDNVPFSEISLPEFVEESLAGPSAEEPDSPEDIEEMSGGESSAQAAKKKKKKKKKSTPDAQGSPSQATPVETKPVGIGPVSLTPAQEKPTLAIAPSILPSEIPEEPKEVTAAAQLTPPPANILASSSQIAIKPVKRTHTHRYHPRVQEWFDNPETALSRPEYATITSVDARKNVIARHTVSTIVDEFMMSFGILTHRENPKTGLMEKNYCIPTEIRWDNGKTDRGLITYALTQDGRIYHRCFSINTPENMVGDLVKKGFFELIDFPPLQRDADQAEGKYPLIAHHEGSHIIEPSKPYKVQIRDDRNGALLTILKVK